MRDVSHDGGGHAQRLWCQRGPDERRAGKSSLRWHSERNAHEPNQVANAAINDPLTAFGYAAQMSPGTTDAEQFATSVNTSHPMTEGVVQVEATRGPR